MAAVVEGHLQHETVVVGGAASARSTISRMSGFRPVAAAEDAHPHAFARQLLQVVVDEALEQAHQFGDLGLGRRQFSVEKPNTVRHADAAVGRGLHGAAQGRHAGPVAEGARQGRRFAQRPLPSMMIATCKGAAAFGGVGPALFGEAGGGMSPSLPNAVRVRPLKPA
jgi:hypothetical protein